MGRPARWVTLRSGWRSRSWGAEPSRPRRPAPRSRAARTSSSSSPTTSASVRSGGCPPSATTSWDTASGIPVRWCRPRCAVPRERPSSRVSTRTRPGSGRTRRMETVPAMRGWNPRRSQCGSADPGTGPVSSGNTSTRINGSGPPPAGGSGTRSQVGPRATTTTSSCIPMDPPRGMASALLPIRPTCSAATRCDSSRTRRGRSRSSSISLPFAPHEPATPAPRHVSITAPIGPFGPPSVTESDLSDKPPWIRRLASGELERPSRTSASSSTGAFGRSTKPSRRSCEAQRARRRLRNTLLVFVSDNGLMWGEHRVMGKFVPYRRRHSHPSGDRLAETAAGGRRPCAARAEHRHPCDDRRGRPGPPSTTSPGGTSSSTGHATGSFSRRPRPISRDRTGRTSNALRTAVGEPRDTSSSTTATVGRSSTTTP